MLFITFGSFGKQTENDESKVINGILAINISLSSVKFHSFIKIFDVQRKINGKVIITKPLDH